VSGEVNFSSLNKFTETSVRSGEAVVGWKEKIQKGRDATSPFSTDSTRIERIVNGDRTLVFAYNATPLVPRSIRHWGLFYNTPSTPTHLTTSSVTTAENDALAKVIKKVKATRQSLNGGSVLGELTKTIHGLRNPYKLLREQVYAHLTTLNKRKRLVMRMPEAKRKKAWREVVAGTWLETNFGMRPVISDARDIAEALARFQFEEPVRTRLRSNSSSLDRLVSTALNQGNSDYLLAYQQVNWKETRTFCTYAVGYEQTVRPAGSVRRLQEVLGLSLENFVPALYEIMPWSWLVDYFTNMGEVIEAGAFSSEGVKWISKSSGRITTERFMCIQDLPRTQALVTGWGAKLKQINGEGLLGDLTLSRATYNRTKPATLGVPSLEFSIPGKGMQIANMVAIAAQLSGRTYDPNMARKLMAKYPIERIRNRGVRSPSDFSVD
jgi:hypothetical protein